MRKEGCLDRKKPYQPVSVKREAWPLVFFCVISVRPAHADMENGVVFLNVVTCRGLFTSGFFEMKEKATPVNRITVKSLKSFFSLR